MMPATRTEFPDLPRATIVVRAEAPTTLVVCIPGSGYDARYFHAPGSSFLDRLAARGHSAVAVTRPGYPADAESARRRLCFADAAFVLESAIADVWERHGAGAAGVVLLGHSVGGAIALHLAARSTQWPLLGVAVSGVGDRPAAGAAEYFAALPDRQVLNLSFGEVRKMFYGPDHTVDERAVPGLAGLLVPMPSGDPIEVNTSWPEDFTAVAPRVRVPVLHAFADRERLWQTGDERRAAIIAQFTSAPFTQSHLIEDSGHNIEHHRSADRYAGAVSEFAVRCAGA